LRVGVLPQRFHCLFGRKNTAAPDQAGHLGPNRDDGQQINQAERPDDNRAGENIGRRLEPISPKNSREKGKERAMLRDKTVSRLHGAREKRGTDVESVQPSSAIVASQRPDRRFRAAGNRAIGLHQMHRLGEPLFGDLWKARGDLVRLEREVFDTSPCELLPAMNPNRAEGAVAIKDEDRFGGEMGYLKRLHAADISRGGAVCRAVSGYV